MIGFNKIKAQRASEDLLIDPLVLVSFTINNYIKYNIYFKYSQSPDFLKMYPECFMLNFIRRNR